MRVPPNCWIEVGGERRTWTEGECIDAAKMVFSGNAKKLLTR